MVHGCLQEAYILELIPRNPASIARPVLERSKDDPEREEAFKAFTLEQAALSRGLPPEPLGADVRVHPVHWNQAR